MKRPTTHGIRTTLNLQGFNDNEVYDLKKEPSLCDPSQDEPIEALVARMLRGEIVLGQRVPRYDFEGPSDPGKEFAAMPPSQRDGFDIADIPGLLGRADEAVRGAAVQQPAQPSPLPEQPKAEPPADLKQ